MVDNMDEFLKPISKQRIKKILAQMDNSIYKIIDDKDNIGICFFCNIKINNKNIHSLITNSEIINEKYLEKNNNIKISTNKEIKTIEFGNTKYINKEHNLSIVEIIENKDNKINFCELDDKLYEKNEVEDFYEDKSIYIICHNDENIISVTYGIINYIDNSKIIYSGYSKLIKNYWPIFNLSNNKLIGLYSKTSDYYNEGIFLKFLINEFINKYKFMEQYTLEKQTKNEISITIKVDKKDINQEIYFLSNRFIYKSYKEPKYLNDNFTELNELNTELFIDYHKLEYKKYFVPKKEGEYNIKLKFNINLTDCSYMFAGCENITNIQFVSFNTNFVRDMKYMFYYCKNIKNINLLLFNTKNVTNMSYMFGQCENLNNLELTSFDTQNVINMSWMFCNCFSLTNLNFSSFNTKNVINFRNMFFCCKNLKNLNLFHFNTESATEIREMFYECANLISLDLSSFDTSKVTSMQFMFSYCRNLINLDLSSFNTKNVNNMKKMFFNCVKLNSLDLSSFDTKNVTNIDGIFFGCPKKIVDYNKSKFGKFEYDDLINSKNF